MPVGNASLMTWFQGKEIEAGDAYGALCMKRAWPGLARTVYGDHQRFMDTYFNIHPGKVLEDLFHSLISVMISNPKIQFV